MATELKTYKTDWKTFPQSKELSLTLFSGGIKNGQCVQFTIGNNHHVLKEKDVRDLIKILQKVIKK